MLKAPKKFVILDGNAIVHRAFHALPPLTAKDGTVVNALYGFLSITFKVLRDLKPDYFSVSFDVKGPTFRHEMYEGYKATRKKQPDELYAQFPLIYDAVDVLGFNKLTLKGFEADDIIGTVTNRIPEEINSYIVTGDMDLLQLVDEHTFVYSMHKGVSNMLTYDLPAVSEKYGGLTVDQLIDYKALRGDPSDNIPGVRGIGDKGAIKLLTEYKTLENIYSHVDDITGATHKKLNSGKEDAMMSKALATIERNAPIEFTLEDAKLPIIDQDASVKMLQKYSFKSLITQLPDVLSKAGITAEVTDTQEDEVSHADRLKDSTYELVKTAKDAKALASKLAKQTIFAFDTETTGLDPLHCELVGFSIAWKAEEAYYITADHVKEFKKIFEDEKIKKVAHNAKFDIKVLQATHDIRVQGLAYDTLLAAYVLNPGARGNSLDALALSEFGYQMLSYKELVGTGKKAILITEVDLDKLAFYAAEDADFTWRLYEVLYPRVKEAKLEKVLQMELDTVPVLTTVEMTGVTVDKKYLNEMSTELGKEIKKLEKKIYKLAGSEFNIASPKQLSVVLFEDLQLDTQGIKKTKTGFSTAAPELEKMRGRHDIIDFVSQYREVAKLKSTYVDTLPELINPKTKRIHTNYSQTIAATGRLSSSDPNLQNIPIRTELGRRIRKAFVAPKGKVLLALDYSQIELRIIAHIANDKIFVDGFKSGADVHTRTAATLQGIPDEEVTKDMRRAAKSVNFGILYGMGSYGLARDSGLSFADAKEYLDKYFLEHPAIEQYIEDTKESTRKTGYAETLFGRKRFLPDMKSGMAVVRAAAERAAINMPVQGTAADLMKMAMLDVAHAIDSGDVDATMLLQVHDELVFEVDAKKVSTEAKKIKKIMEDVYTLNVPLVVDVGVGSNWMELEPIEL